MNDRLRAQAPPPTAEGWRAGVVRRVDRRDSGYVVTVAPDDTDGTDGTDDPVDVTVSTAIYDLFSGRLDRPVDTPDDVVGARVWFK